MDKQRGISFVGIIGGLFLMLYAYTAGSMRQSEVDMSDLDALLAETCDTQSHSSGRLLTSSDKIYRCQFVRNMTPVEIAERKQRVDEANGRTSKKVEGEQADSATQAPRGADPAETREK